MTTRVFTGKIAYTRRWMHVGVGLLIAAAVVIAALVATIHGRAERVLPWVAWPAGLGFMACMFAAMIPRAATITVDGGSLVLSWRARPVRIDRITIGRWVLPAIDTAIGLVVHVDGDGGRVTIGGHDHDGAGYRVDGAPVRSVDCQLAAADFDQLCAAIGASRGAAPSGAILVELTRNSQSAGGVFRTMAPWLLTMVAVSAFSAILGTTGLFERLERWKQGPMVIGGVTMAIIAFGLWRTIRAANRVKGPALTLALDERGVTLARPDGAEVARAGWSGVRGIARVKIIRYRGGSMDVPVIELTLGDHPTITIGVWDSRAAWGYEVPKTRSSPRYLIGSPQWPAVVGALRARSALS